MRKRSPLSSTMASAAVLACVAASPAAAAVGTGQKGPSTTVAPYVLPVADGVETTSLLTVGDLPAGNGYSMVGIPDGLGARNALTAANKLELFMNHELRETQGAVRAHGQRGAFVSNYVTRLRHSARYSARAAQSHGKRGRGQPPNLEPI